MRNTKNAFTLVELIVVITILAILGTIAFISLQGYSADARNSKRTSDVGNIQSSMSLKQVEGVPLLSFIADSSNLLAGIALGGTGAVDDTTVYNAGKPSYTVLNVVEKDFLDPKSDEAYRIGATTLKGGVFQVAATMEADGDSKALVNGTYVARGINTYSGTADGTRFTLLDENANRFKVSDYVQDNNSAVFQISKVSRDGVTLTLDGTSTGSNLRLVSAEDAGLILGSNDTGTVTGALENDSLTIFPY